MAQYDISKLGSGLEFDATTADSTSSAKVPGNDWVIQVWKRSTTLCYVQVFSVNTSNGALTAIGSPLDIETGTMDSTSDGASIVAIDSTNAMAVWCGVSSDGFAQLITIDGSGNCTANGSPLEYDTTNGQHPSAILWDSTHVLVAWNGTDNDGYAQVLLFVTGTGTITTVGTALEFDTTNCSRPSVAQLSSTKAVVFYSGALSDGFAIVLDVAAVTYAVTAAGSAFEYLDSSTITHNSVVVVNSASSPMVVANAWYNAGTFSIRTFNINTTTWAITAFGAQLDLYTGLSFGNTNGNSMFLYDATHLVCSTNGTSDDGYANVLSYNSGTGALVSVSSVAWKTVDFTQNCIIANIGSGICVASGTENATTDGFMQTLRISGDPTATAKFFPFLDRR